METITAAALLKDTAPRSHVALFYGLLGVIVGTFVLGGD